MGIHFTSGMVICIMRQKHLYTNTKYCLIKIEQYLLCADQKKQTISFQIA